jgi:hypothetical protein
LDIRDPRRRSINCRVEPICWRLALYSARGMVEQESEAAKAVVGAEKLTLVRMCGFAGRERLMLMF